MKYIICNLKTHLNEYNITDYLNTIKKINYNNFIICPEKKYISLFHGFKVCTQDFYEDVKSEYTLIGHFEKHDTIEDIKEKIIKATNKKLKIILCIGNNDIEDYNSIKEQLNYYLNNINGNIIIAYEPYNMIGSINEVNIDKLDVIIKKIKKDFNNITVLYGGNVNTKNIKSILQITDGVLMARMSYNPHKLTNLLNNLKKSI